MVTDLLRQCASLGVTLAPGDNGALRVSPPGMLPDELKAALKAHKAAILRVLMTPGDRRETPCPCCGATDWRETPDGGRWCVPCVLAGRDPVAAVKVQSPVLDTAVWVVADGLPRETWPTDAPVYRQRELKILQRVGTDTRAWVHVTKTMFHAHVVDGGRRPTPDPVPLGEDSEQE